MNTKTIVWHEPTDRHAIVDHPSQVSDFVNEVMGRPNEASVDVIPKEFHVFSDIPHYAMQGE